MIYIHARPFREMVPCVISCRSISVSIFFQKIKLIYITIYFVRQSMIGVFVRPCASDFRKSL